MVKTLITLSAAFVLLSASPEDRPVTTGFSVKVATCTGAKSCRACKNCKYCKHCSKSGGTCGVCK